MGVAPPRRIGGDEFAILCDGIGARDEAVALGQEIRAIFATPFDVSPLGVRLTCACGFALFPSTAVEPDELVRLADAALYRAKASGLADAAMFETRAGRTAASGGRLRGRPSSRGRSFGARRPRSSTSRPERRL